MDSYKGDIVGIINYEPQLQKKIQEALIHVVKELGIELQAFEYVQLHLSVSGQALSMGKLSECQAQAQRAKEQRYFLEKSVLLTDAPEDAEIPEENIFKKFSSALQKSIDLQNSMQLESSIHALRDTVLSYEVTGSQVLRIIKTAYNLFLFSGMFQSEYLFFPAEETMAEFNQRADLCCSASDLFNLLSAVCVKNLEDACQWINQEKIRPINLAKQYILEHYAEPLSLDDVCSQVGFSASYFSTLFRKETGTNFLEYLGNIRMEEAKKLLRETNMTIETVCEVVGIHDTKRFSKSFKNATGISPREYRKLYS
jgi:two-component system response regulator YesN